MGVGVMQGGTVTSAVVTRPERRGLAAKRALDIVVSALVLLVLSPVLAVLAVLILVAEGRPILFRQQRVGRHGELFTMYKFRTMVVDAHERLGEVAHANERGGPLFKASDDPRITGIGRFLRRTSLDELPQFFNVANGTMSLVGPRPSLPEERAEFPAELLEREELPQGLTGLWQVEGRTDHAFSTYRDLDLAYVRTWSLGRDLSILVRTPVVVVRHALRGEGAAPTADPQVEPDAAMTPEPATGAEARRRPHSTPVGSRSWSRVGERRVPSSVLASSSAGIDD